MERTNKKALINLILAMLIFGTIGVFRRGISLPSGALAMARGFIGALFLLFYTKCKGQKRDVKGIRKNLWLLLLSGALIGFNWILLFEAYGRTTVATATLCYYMAPVFVILASPLLLKEKLTAGKICCALAAVLGMVFVSGLPAGSAPQGSSGVWLGLGAAVLYACVVLLNKKIQDIHPFDKTILQLAAAGAVLIPYVFFIERDALQEAAFTPELIGLVLLVGIIHTGVAYALYFGAIPELPAQTSALFSYVDPVSALFFAAVFLGESLTPLGAVGALLILGAAAAGELLR